MQLGARAPAPYLNTTTSSSHSGPPSPKVRVAHCLCAQADWCFQFAALWPCLLCRPVRQCASSSRQRCLLWFECAACSSSNVVFRAVLRLRATKSIRPIRAGRVGVAVMAAHDGRLDGNRKFICKIGPNRSSPCKQPHFSAFLKQNHNLTRTKSAPMLSRVHSWVANHIAP
jgi:hypothetical protein